MNRAGPYPQPPPEGRERMLADEPVADVFARAFRAALSRPESLARFDDVLPVYWGGARLNEWLTITLGRQAGPIDLRDVVGPLLRRPYRLDAEPAPAGASRARPATAPRTYVAGAGSRTIRIAKGSLTLLVGGTVRRGPCDDHGQQDAIVAVFAGPLAQLVAALHNERWTDTPFEEGPGRTVCGDDARRELRRLSECTVGLEVEADFFPGGRIDLYGVGQREPFYYAYARERAPQRVWLRPGHYRLRARVAAASLPGCPLGPWAGRDTVVWTSPVFPFEAPEPGIYRLRVAAPEAARALSESEALYLATRGASPKPRPRENLEVTFLRHTPLPPRGRGRRPASAPAGRTEKRADE